MFFVNLVIGMFWFGVFMKINKWNIVFILNFGNVFSEIYVDFVVNLF